MHPGGATRAVRFGFVAAIPIMERFLVASAGKSDEDPDKQCGGGERWFVKQMIQDPFLVRWGVDTNKKWVAHRQSDPAGVPWQEHHMSTDIKFVASTD
jgi:hypothetical protein